MRALSFGLPECIQALFSKPRTLARSPRARAAPRRPRCCHSVGLDVDVVEVRPGESREEERSTERSNYPAGGIKGEHSRKRRDIVEAASLADLRRKKGVGTQPPREDTENERRLTRNSV